MRILNLSRGADTGGQGILIKRAFDAHSDWTYDQAAASINYIRYPRHMDARRVNPARYDVVHDNNRIRPNPRGPTVIHYHGTGFRETPGAFLRAQRAIGASGLVSTLDLWLLAPDEVTWCPAPYDLDWLAAYRKPMNGDMFRVGHAPTDRAIKSTAALVAAVKRLNREHPTRLVLIERRPWAECLTRKGTVDVFFDQVLLGYGNNAIEAWGMGIPVIAGGPPATLAEMRRRFGGLPFVEATEDTIYETLRSLVDPEVRAYWGRRGLAHVRRFHDAAAAVELLTGIYQQTFDRYHSV